MIASSSVLQSGDEFIAGEVMQQHLHARRGFLKRRKRWRQYLHCGRRRVADVQLAIVSSRQRANLIHGFIARQVQKQSSLGGERDAARAAFEQIHADFFLQILHLPAQSGLRNAQLRRRLREAQRFAHGEEISEMPEFHCDSHYAEKAWQRKEHGIGRIRANGRIWFQMVAETTQTK